LVQGFALGGEVGASTSLLLEYADDNSRGYYSSFQTFSQALSSLMASAIALTLTKELSTEALEAWGWRVPFILGIVVLPVGIWIRRHVDETLGERRQSASATLAEVFGTQLRNVGSGIMLLIGGTCATYIVIFYLANYATTFLEMPLGVTLWSSVASSAAMAMTAPLAGWCSDRFGRKRVLAYSRGLQCLTILPCFAWLGATRTLQTLLGVVVLQSVLTTFSAVAAILAISEACPRHVRATATSVIYGFGVAAFGGSAQVVATWLIANTGNQLAPAWYLIACNVISMLPLLWVKEMARRPA
jgi:MFS family permease